MDYCRILRSGVSHWSATKCIRWPWPWPWPRYDKNILFALRPQLWPRYVTEMYLTTFDLDLDLDLDMTKDIHYGLRFRLWLRYAKNVHDDFWPWPWPWFDLNRSKMINGLRPRFWPRYVTWPWPWPWPVKVIVFPNSQSLPTKVILFFNSSLASFKTKNI